MRVRLLDLLLIIKALISMEEYVYLSIPVHQMARQCVKKKVHKQ